MKDFEMGRHSATRSHGPVVVLATAAVIGSAGIAWAVGGGPSGPAAPVGAHHEPGDATPQRCGAHAHPTPPRRCRWWWSCPRRPGPPPSTPAARPTPRPDHSARRPRPTAAAGADPHQAGPGASCPRRTPPSRASDRLAGTASRFAVPPSVLARLNRWAGTADRIAGDPSWCTTAAGVVTTARPPRRAPRPRAPRSSASSPPRHRRRP